MQGGTGTFFVIEGTDGSGKATQLRLLAEQLTRAGHDVVSFDFPQYDVPSSYFVKQYLNGAYGAVDDVGPYTASLFYALDRYQAAGQIRQALEAGKVVLANRFVGSNMAHQGTKFFNAEERRGYFIWLDNLEFEMLHIPRPTMSFVLRVPAETAQKLVDGKAPRQYTDKQRDIHEADLGHLQRAVEVYDDLTQLFPKDFQRIDCVRDEQLLPIEAVQDLMWQKIKPLLPEPHKKTGSWEQVPPQTAAEVTTADPPASQKPGLSLPPLHIDSDAPAVMPAPEPTPLAPLPTPPATTTSPSFELAALSQLAAATLPAAAKLTTPAYEQRAANGQYRYYVPDQFSPELQSQYRDYVDQIFALYSSMLPTLTTYLADHGNPLGRAYGQATATLQAVLPVAATAKVQLKTSPERLRRLIVKLLSNELGEARQAGEAVLQQARALDATFLDANDEPARSNAIVAYRATTRHAVAAVAEANLPDNHAAESAPVSLTDVTPRNELDLVADVLYEHSTVPLSQLRAQVGKWSYDQKLQVLEAYLGQRAARGPRPGAALEKARYSWDIVSDFATFRAMQRFCRVDDRAWQQLTPRHGYDVPQLIDDADLTEQYETCFDLSLRLYSLIQTAEHPTDLQYATLQGHKLRWKMSCNARELFSILEQAVETGAPGVPALIRQIHETLAEKHPLLAEAMQLSSPAANSTPSATKA